MFVDKREFAQIENKILRELLESKLAKIMNSKLNDSMKLKSHG